MIRSQPERDAARAMDARVRVAGLSRRRRRLGDCLKRQDLDLTVGNAARRLGIAFEKFPLS
jgi:hypothetical protein